jgi:serine/threonine protein kinase
VASGGTRTGAVLGTPCYLAPEQADGKAREVGPAADVYALGATLYELLTGRPPFVGENPLDVLLQVRTDEPIPPSRLRPRTPRDLETICLKCLEKAPARRYAGAQDLADDLRRFVDGRPVAARPVGRGEKLWRWCKRKPLVAGLSAALVAVLIGSVIALAVLWQRADDQRARAEDNLDQAWRAVREHFIQLSDTEGDDFDDPKQLRKQTRRSSAAV